jgi:tyrocidine synthetase III
MNDDAGHTTVATSLERALRALKDMRAKIEMLEQARYEPIAIIGMGCRFPGANGLKAFWQLLTEGRDAISEVPRERWDMDLLYDPDPDALGKMYTRWGGFLDHIDLFDAQFFDIAPREALSMDPQQRILLEVVFEALEHAGQATERLAQSQTGVFIALGTNEYARLQEQAEDELSLDVYAGTGNATSIAAGRISYLLGLQGPCMVVDTACSSSLVAIHLASQSLRNRECNMALAGGINLILLPDGNIAQCRARMAAMDGRCKTFDAQADGYVRSEGCGVVVLKRLSDALADGDPILALIRGSAINQDGRSNGLTAPNRAAQEAVIRAALAQAQVHPGQIDYVETHGTGTSLGDPIEVRALNTVLKEGHSKERPLIIGSLKTNIGHTEAAAGIAGLIKVVLALWHDQIPPQLHLHTPNPYIEWDTIPVRVATEPIAWQKKVEGRFAGVSSFGVSGTNAHVVLQGADNAPLSPSAPRAAAQPRLHLLPISASSPRALFELCKAYIAWLSQISVEDEESFLQDLCYTASVRRTHYPYRLTALGESKDELVEHLRAAMQQRQEEAESEARPTMPKQRIVFVFPGQGAQWIGMGRQLLHSEPVFLEALKRCELAMKKYVDWSLLEVLEITEEHAYFERIDIVQPVLTCLQIALVELWASWGIKPHAVVGHSMGEVAAAYASGALDLDDAVCIICTRSLLLKTLQGKGAMAVIELSQEQAEALLAAYDGSLISLAASNSPRSTILSGDRTVLDTLLAQQQQQGVFCRHVRVDVASHSPQMDPLLPELKNILKKVQPQRASIPMYSTVTGEPLTGEELDAAYWADNLRSPVLFSTAIQRLVREGHTLFIEISPHPVLRSALEENLLHSETDGVVLPSLWRAKDDLRTLFDSLCALYQHGCHITWSGLFPMRARHISLPSYPWQHERFWITSRGVSSESKNNLLKKTRSGQHIAESAQALAVNEHLYELSWWPSPRAMDVKQDSRSISSPEDERCWLIFTDSSGIGQQTAARLRDQGHVALEIAVGDTCKQMDKHHFTVGADDVQSMQHLFTHIVRTPGYCNLSILYLWGLDIQTPEEHDVECLEMDTYIRQYWRLISLIHALDKQAWIASSTIWLFTRGSQSVGGAPTDIAIFQAPIWGLGRVLKEEHPDWCTHLVDLDNTASLDRCAEFVVNEIFHTDAAWQVAMRQDDRYTLHLARNVPAAVSKEIQWRHDGSYLITGGFGDLGLQVARWMAQQGARRIILCGRTPLPAREHWGSKEIDARQTKMIAAIRELEMSGVSVHWEAFDVANAEELHAFLQRFRREGWPPIRGVVHTAGTLEDRLLQQLDTDALQAVMRPKVFGSWYLHALLREDDIDFFVCFSSMGALLGVPGQGSYAAANVFMDALAHYRRLRQLPALSINWGPWSQLGFANSVGARNMSPYSTQRGIEGFSAEQALDVFSALLGSQATQVAAVRIDWSRYLQQSQEELASFLSPLQSASTMKTYEMQSTPVLDTLNSLEVEQERLQYLEEHIKMHLSQILRMEAARIGRDASFGQLGMDSIMGLELRNRLERHLNLKLSATLIWNYPTLTTLTRYIARLLGLQDKAASSLSEAIQQDNLEQEVKIRREIQQLSDDDAETLLAAKLAMFDERT